MRWLYLFFFTLCLGASCENVPRPTPVPPTDTDQCDAACAKMRELGCEEGQPLEDGTTCEKFCRDTHEQGLGMNPTCIVQKVVHCYQLGENFREFCDKQ